MDNKQEALRWFKSDLTIYVAEVRYPNKLEIECSHMIQALSGTEKIREFVAKYIHPVASSY